MKTWREKDGNRQTIPGSRSRSPCLLVSLSPCLLVRSALTITLLTPIVGCGGKGDVSGQVTFKGKPLVFGTVQFEANDKTFKQGNINRDGTYSIDGVPVGEAKVAVNSPNPKSGDFQPLQREGRPP